MLVFPNLALNTNRVYGSVIDKSGCEIYFPASSIEEVPKIKKMLQDFVDAQPEPAFFVPPPTAG